MSVIASEPTTVPTPGLGASMVADSTMSEMQLAWSVRMGRKVILFSFMFDHPIEGYLAGWDDRSYFVLSYDTSTQTLRKLLFPRAETVIELPELPTLSKEESKPARDAYARILTPFTTRVLQEYFPDIYQHTRGKEAADV